MKTQLNNRLKHLEGRMRTQEQPVIILQYVDMNRKPLPIIGYRVGDEQLIRHEGETDDELEERACRAFRDTAGSKNALLLDPIIEEA